MSGTPGAIQQYTQDGEQNRILRGLPPSSHLRLRPYLEPVALSLKQVLWNADDALSRCIDEFYRTDGADPGVSRSRDAAPTEASFSFMLGPPS